MKYGIICAVTPEIELIRKDIVNEKVTTIARRTYSEGVLYGKDVVLVMSEVGKVASALTATILISKFDIDCVVFCGTAGATSSELNVGDVVVADSLIQHDLFNGTEHFKLPMLDMWDFAPEKKLSDDIFKAVQSYIDNEGYKEIPTQYLEEFHIKSPKVVVGTIASGDQFINDKNKTQWLSDNINNLKCVEMEGAAVGQVCYDFSTPLAVVRVISDSANEESDFDFFHFAKEAMPYFTRGALKSYLN